MHIKPWNMARHSEITEIMRCPLKVVCVAWRGVDACAHVIENAWKGCSCTASRKARRMVLAGVACASFVEGCD
uniref:Uncharacterized protein n=1 Tax=Oryza meridionalis TaxID=40149 RepID=A0A0E0C7X7_9ORYZ